MADYEILSDINTPIPARDIDTRTVDILIDAGTIEAATPILRKAANELLTDYALTIHAYIEREAVKWQGWIGRVEYYADGVPRIYFDNDPYLREALYRDASA
jgi:hypothetical protein